MDVQYSHISFDFGFWWYQRWDDCVDDLALGISLVSVNKLAFSTDWIVRCRVYFSC